MGPEERSLRIALESAGGLSAIDEARLGAVGRWKLFDYLRKGIAYRGGDNRARLKQWAPDPFLKAAHQQDKQRRQQLQAQHEERARLAQVEMERRARDQAAQRSLFAGTERLSIEDRRIIVAERLAVLAELTAERDGQDGQTQGQHEQEEGGQREAGAA